MNRYRGLNTDLQARNGLRRLAHMTKNSKRINQSNEVDSVALCDVALRVSILSIALPFHTRYSALYENEEIIKCWSLN